MWFAGLGLSIALFVEVLHPFMTWFVTSSFDQDRNSDISSR